MTLQINLSGLFRKNKKIELENEEIKLYCQNPQCENSLISKDEDVVNIEGNLIHSDRDCVEMYMCYRVLKSGKMMIFSNIPCLPYAKAEKLAREGKVKFSKLETGVKK